MRGKSNVSGVETASMSVRAESLVQLLHGLNEVEISVADLDEDAKTCGITKELIKNTVALALNENTSIKVIDENSEGGYAADIYVRISTTYIPKIGPMPQRDRAGGQKASYFDNEKTMPV